MAVRSIAAGYAAAGVMALAYAAMACAGAGCRVTGSSTPATDGGVVRAGAAPGPSQVELTWRLFETQHALDSNGEDTATAVFELLANGGTPSRVALGRRASLGCMARDTPEDPAVVASLECHAHAHGEYVRVLRPTPGQLRVEAYGQDEAYPDQEPPRTALRAATVEIPADAEIVLDHEVSTVPDEVRPR
jgi:hypothetical protein